MHCGDQRPQAEERLILFLKRLRACVPNGTQALFAQKEEPFRKSGRNIPVFFKEKVEKKIIRIYYRQYSYRILSENRNQAGGIVMNILRLRYFIDTAESKSFTKAAQKNYVSQPVISQQIAAMERELEVTLFSREKGKVTLTPAGESFYEDALRIVDLYDQAVKKVRHIHREGGGTIVLGLVTGTEMTELYELVNSFHEKWPDTVIRPVQETFNGMGRKLESGEVDVAIAPAYDMRLGDQFEVQCLRRFNMGVLVSLENPLSERDTVEAKELADQDIVMIAPEFGTETYHHMVEQRLQEGYNPRIVETAQSMEFLLMLVEMNRGIAFVPDCMTRYNRERCKWIQIVGSEDRPEFSIAYRKDNRNHAVAAFADLVVDYFKKHYPGEQ